MPTIKISDIQEFIILSGMTIDLHKRLREFMRGKTVINQNEIYLVDALAWIEWEGILPLSVLFQDVSNITK